MTSPSELRVRRGIARLLIRAPFYASILLRLRLRECEFGGGAGTFGTDGRVLYYSPTFMKTLSDEELCGVLAHEATHVAALHPIRKGARKNHIAWNVCADHEVNNIVVTKEEMTLPEGCVEPREGLAEAFYTEMMENAKPCPGCGGKEEHLKNDDGEYNDGCKGPGWCTVMEPELAPGEDPAEVMQEIEDTVRQAVAQAQMWGKMPKGMEQYIEEYLTPKLKWDEILRRFCEDKYEPTIDWSSPNRRFIHKGIILPGNGRKRSVSEIALAVDTSGSMLGDVLVQAVSEVRHVIDEHYSSDTELPVIWFDTESHLDWITQDDDLIPKGGGGTDFSCVMRAYEEEGLDQSGLVIVTDGYCGEFGEEPSVPVLWVVFGSYAKEFKPPFGEIIELPFGENV